MKQKDNDCNTHQLLRLTFGKADIRNNFTINLVGSTIMLDLYWQFYVIITTAGELLLHRIFSPLRQTSIVNVLRYNTILGDLNYQCSKQQCKVSQMP